MSKIFMNQQTTDAFSRLIIGQRKANESQGRQLCLMFDFS